MSDDTQVKQEAPERIWLQRFEDGEQEFSMLWYESDLRPLMSEPPEKQRPFHAIQYVRADLLATVRREVWNEAIRAAQISAKKSQVAGLNIASAEILIRRLERASATEKEGMNG